MGGLSLPALDDRARGSDPSRRPAGRFHLFIAVAGLGLGMTAPLTALYARALGASDPVAGFAVASVALSLLPLDILGTRLVPALDGRLAISLALAIFGAGSLASAVAPNLPLMVGARVFQGLGAGLFMTGGLQVAARTAPPGREGHAVGIFNAALFLGIAAGPIAGGALTALEPGVPGLRLAFMVCAAVNLAAAAVCRLGLPAIPSDLQPSVGPPPLRGLMRPRRLLGALLLGGLGQGMQVGIPFTLIPIYATRRLHLDPLAVSGALTALSAANIGSMFLAGRIGDHRGRLAALVPALLWGAAVLWLTPSAGSLPLLAAFCAGIGVTVGTFAVIPPVMVVDLATDRPVGIAGYRICADLGMLAGGVGAGALAGLAGGGGALHITGAALLGSVVLALRVGETRPRSPVLPPPPGGRRFEEVPG